MLISLSVKQFALIEHVHLELSAGMTVFTGETGAGKSMLVGALGAVFGARASAEWVRHGAEKAEVTALWQAESPLVRRILEANDIDVDDELILRRVVTQDGRSRAYINGVPVALKTLRRIGDVCLDFHGQHEHQSLLQPAVQQHLIDAALQGAVLHDVGVAFSVWKKLQNQLKTMQSERGESEQQASWMRQELSQLEGLDLELELGKSLQSEVDAGRHHAQVQQAAAEALMLLDEAEPCVRDLLARAGQALVPVEDFHAGLSESRALLDQMDDLLGETVPQLNAVLYQSFDEAGLRQSEERLMALHECKRRHDCDEAGLLQLMQDWQQRLAALDTSAWDEASLLQALQQAAESYREQADRLTTQRQACAESIVKQLRPFLDRLALVGMQLRFDVLKQLDEQAWSAQGWDAIGMQVMSNPGEPWRDLAAVASGGEVSRLVLALKGCGSLDDMSPLAVFDEVDTGIGGETAWCVGELLAAMGRDRQVLVISHLPQVAACAAHQIVIDKREKGGRTVTQLDVVQAGDRQLEIARMLGGSDADSLNHADRFLIRGQPFSLS